jgi:hypothetical protein
VATYAGADFRVYVAGTLTMRRRLGFPSHDFAVCVCVVKFLLPWQLGGPSSGKLPLQARSSVICQLLNQGCLTPRFADTAVLLTAFFY